MSDSKKKVPKRRFEEFSNANDWEQRKLGGLMNITSVKRIHQSDWTDKGVRFLRARDIVSASKGKNPSEYLYISKKLYDEHSKISGKVGVGDLLVTGVGSIGIPMLIKHEEPLYFKDGNIIWFQNKKNIDGGFFYYSFNSHSIQKFIRDSAGIGTVGTYTIDSGGKTPIYLPNKKEQQRIGTFFKQLDNTIALHQRKLEKIKALKTAYLSEMFPAEGETKPKRRFAGFTDDWEQRELNQVADIFDGTHQTPKYTDSGVKFVSVENISTLETKKHISQEAYDKEYSNKKVEQGDVLMTRIGDIGTAKVIEQDEPLAYYVTLALLKLQEIDSNFLAQQIASPKVQRNIWKRTLHIAFPKKINLGEINQIEIFIPNFEEQHKLGTFFKQLDNTIALHQCKLQKLQNIKKAYLNEMFI